MRIVVCVKQIRHIYARTGLDPSTHFVAEEDVVPLINPLDELAVEEALRQRGIHGGEVILVTLGELLAEEGLRRCLAMGADRVIRIHDPAFHITDAWSTAAVLSSAIQQMQPDLVLCGKEALDDGAGQVGVIIAERLGIPCVCGVVRLETRPAQGEAVVHRALERGDREVVQCPFPALFTVEKGLNEPRYPRLEPLLEAQNREVEVWDAGRIEVDPEAGKPLTSVVKLFPPKPRTRKARAPDSSLSAQARIQMLMGGGAAAKKKKESSSLVELPPREAAEKVLAFLLENNFF